MPFCLCIPSFWQNCSEEGRFLGIDVGKKTLGLSLSDTRGVVATPFTTILRKKWSHDQKVLHAFIEKENVQGIVVGLPLTFAGKRNTQCQSVRDFSKNLLRIVPLLPLVEADERFSTIVAKRILSETSFSFAKRKQKTHEIAAAYILQGVLNQRAR